MNSPLKRYFGKSLSSSWWKQLLCLVTILMVLSPASALLVCMANRESEGVKYSVSDALEVYLDPGNFCTKVNTMYIKQIGDVKESAEIEKSIAEGCLLKKDNKNRPKAYCDVRPFDELMEDKNVNRYDFGMTKGIIDIIRN